MKKFYFLISLTLPLGLSSQEDDSYNLDYNNSRNATELCIQIKSNGFMSNTEADEALSKILSVVGASKRFIVAPCENINNALAVIDDGMRYILYDPEFINSISQTSDYWANMSILAHEVGHHINGHTLGSSVSSYENKIIELEADEFSGFVMQKIGATLEQATDAISNLAPSGDDTYSSHPNKERRIKAITKGFNNAKNNNFINEKKLTDWEEFYFRGEGKYESNDYEGAIDDFTESLKLRPDAQTYFKRGRAKGLLGDASGEKFDYIRSIELDPDNWQANYFLGINLYFADDYFGALSAFRAYNNLVKWQEDYWDLYSLYYMSKCFLEEGFYEKSLKYIDIILSETDFTAVIDALDIASFYNQRALAYFKLENFVLARTDFEKASELDPLSAYYKELNGDNYAKEGNYEKAIDLYNQALELDADSYSIYEYRAYAYEALEDYFNALLDINEAIKYAPDYGDLYFKRGEYRLKMGDTKSSCSDWLIGNEKGSASALNKLLEICGYSEEDFFSAEDFLNAGIEETKDQNFEEALRLLNKSQEKGYVDLRYLKAYLVEANFGSGRYKVTLEILEEIKGLINSDELPWLVWWNEQLLKTNYELKNWEALASKAEELIVRFKLDPDSLDFSLNRDFLNDNPDFTLTLFDLSAQAYKMNGAIDKALAVGNKFLKVGRSLDNDDYKRVAYLRLAEAKIASENYLEALQDINEYIKLNKDHYLGYQIRGEIKLKMGQDFKKYACDDFNLALQASLQFDRENEELQKSIQKQINVNCN